MHGDDESMLPARVWTHIRQRQFQNVNGTSIDECLYTCVCVGHLKVSVYMYICALYNVNVCVCVCVCVCVRVCVCVCARVCVACMRTCM